MKKLLLLIALLAGSMPVSAYEINRIIQDATYSSPAPVEELAIYNLITNGDVVVGEEADVTFKASRIKLNPGFQVEADADFTALAGDQSAYMYNKEFTFDKDKDNTLFYNPLIMSSLGLYFHFNSTNRNFRVRVHELTNAGESYIVTGSDYCILSPVATSDPLKYSFSWNGKITAGATTVYANEGRCRLFLMDEATNKAVDYMDIVVDMKLDQDELVFLNNYKNLNLASEKKDFLARLVHYAVFAETSSLYNTLMEINQFLDTEIREAGIGTALNMYNLMINYKELTKEDIEELARSQLNILSRNQGMAARKIRELSGNKAKNFGYVDGAGVSAFEPGVFYLDTATGTAYLKDEDGDVIPGSADWFIRDKEGGYCNYWNETGYMMHISHPDYRQWFYTNRIRPMIEDFDGIFLDDIWSSVYDGQEKIDDIEVYYENSTSDWLGDTWLTDYSAQWEANAFAGKELLVEGKTALITGNSSNVLWITTNTINQTGAGIGYQIVEATYLNQVKSWLGYGETYAVSMVRFLKDLKSYLAERGKELIINMWLENEALTPDYAEQADYIVNEALTHTWNMNNFVTKQTVYVDPVDARSRFSRQLAGHNTKLITIAYPFNSQTHLELVAANLLFSPWNREKDEPRAFVTASNINLSQVYLNEIMTADIGRPVGELSRQTTSDGEHFMYRIFENGILFYNPGRREIAFPFLFPYDACTYPERHVISAGENVIRMPSRAAVYAARSGSEFHTRLSGNAMYTKKDDNAAFILFTETGKNKIGTNSVWIADGFSNNKYFVFDGTAAVPAGESIRLFHAGNGADSAVEYRNPAVETITPLLRVPVSRSIYAVVRVADVQSGVVLARNTDYKVKRSNFEYLAEGQVNWDTTITVLNPAYGDHDLFVTYYDKSVDDYYYKEHGIFYRDNENAKLYTGGINQAESTLLLTEGTDYFAVPETTVWQWDYLYPEPVPATADSYTVNTRQMKPDWGSVDVNSIILVNPAASGTGEMNGSMVKIADSDVTVKKPRILVYGFRKKVRNVDTGETIPPAERVVDNWNPESRLKNDEGILFDKVVVTGDYDDYGSITGFLNSGENTIGGISALISYFDAVVILDPLLEQPGRDITDWNAFTPIFHANGKGDFESWLTQADYNLIAGFNRMIIDKRGGIKAFEWYADRSYTMPPGELVFTYKHVKSDLPTLYPVFGVRLIEGANVGTGYIPYSSYRMLYAHLEGVSDSHYAAGEILNTWEEGNDFASFIPRFRRDLSTGRIYNNFVNGGNGCYHISFMIEQATGNISGTAYYKGNAAPNILCLGISYADLLYLLINQIGTELTFSGLNSYRSNAELKLCYNVLTDNLTYQYSANQQTIYADEVESGSTEVVLGDFTANPGKSITLTARVSGSGTYSYAWDLGDGTTSNLAAPDHVYYHANWDDSRTDYRISLTVTDANNDAYTVNSVVQVVNTSSGSLAADEVWSGEHTLNGDITIPAGRALTVMPGTKINLTGNAAGSTDHQITISGNAVIEGAVFKMLADGNSLWKGIYVTGAAIFADCIIENAKRGIVVAPGADVAVEGCTFLDNQIGMHVIDNDLPVGNSNFLGHVYYGLKEDGVCQVEADYNVFGSNANSYYTGSQGVITIEELNALPGNSGNSGE